LAARDEIIRSAERAAVRSKQRVVDRHGVAPLLHHARQGRSRPAAEVQSFEPCWPEPFGERRRQPLEKASIAGIIRMAAMQLVYRTFFRKRGQRVAIDENQGAVATTEVPPAPILMEVRDVSGTAKRASPHDSKRLRTNPVDRNGADGLRRNAASNSGVRVEQPHLDAGF